MCLVLSLFVLILFFLSFFLSFFLPYTIKDDCLAIYDNFDFAKKNRGYLKMTTTVTGFTNRQEVLTLILKIFPVSFRIEPIESHEDTLSSYDNLTSNARLNIEADDTVSKNATHRINTHILTDTFTIYVNNKYAHHRIDHHIRINTHAQKAKNIL